MILLLFDFDFAIRKPLFRAHFLRRNPTNRIRFWSLSLRVCFQLFVLHVFVRKIQAYSKWFIWNNLSINQSNMVFSESDFTWSWWKSPKWWDWTAKLVRKPFPCSKCDAMKSFLCLHWKSKIYSSICFHRNHKKEIHFQQRPFRRKINANDLS